MRLAKKYIFDILAIEELLLTIAAKNINLYNTVAQMKIVEMI